MTTTKRATTSKENIHKTPSAGYYRVEIRPSRDFASFRTQDVGSKGGLERVAGHRTSGSWATQAWLVSKNSAHVTDEGELVIDNIKERASLKKVIRGKIMFVEDGTFHAHPARNIPEKDKPTPAMRTAQQKNIKKAQAARRKKV